MVKEASQPDDRTDGGDRTRERAFHRYDSLFKSTFIHLCQIAALLRAWLTVEKRDQFDWKTLSVLPAGFVDDSLRRTEADLLFQIRHLDRGDGTAAGWTCILVEHQSSPDPNMDFRLLKYGASVLEAARRRAAKGDPDPRILPVLFHHGERPWPYPQTLHWAMEDFSPRGVCLEYLLIDQAAGTPADIAGAPLGRLVQMLFYATTGPRERRDEAVGLLPDAVAAVLDAGHELSELKPLFVYLQGSKEDIVLKTVVQALDAYENPEPAREFRSLGERLRAEGRAEGLREFRSLGERLRAEGRAEGLAEGRAEERVAVVAGFLGAGASWNLIQTATGLDESSFEALKKQVAAQ